MAQKNSKQIKIEEVMDKEEPTVIEVKAENTSSQVTENKEKPATAKKGTSAKKRGRPKTSATKKAKKVASKKTEEPKDDSLVENLSVESENATYKKSKKAKNNKEVKPETKKSKLLGLFSKKNKLEEEEMKQPKRVKRVKAIFDKGLTSDQVAERVSKNQTNKINVLRETFYYVL